jgi:predicted nucleotidyltransferase
MSNLQNVTRIKVVYDALQELAGEVVFVGGAVVSLYADRPAIGVRPTDDVDIVVELMSYSGFAAVEEKLRKKGFAHDKESRIICRYKINGVIVDIMPTGEGILGFSNKWYADAFANSFEFLLDDQYRIRLFQPAWFIASKLEAFNDRGGNDGRMSSDFEDIVFILNNRNDIWQEMRSAPEPVKKYLKEQFNSLLANQYIYEWIGTHLEFSEQRRVNLIIGGLNQLLN